MVLKLKIKMDGPLIIQNSPGIPGLSERITIRSIVGRFLEHSRIYRFGEPAAELRALQSATYLDEHGEPVAPERPPVPQGANAVRYVIGSGDLMERNLDRRIEALVPVCDLELCAHLEDLLELALGDDEHAWELDADGNWHRLGGRDHRSLQRRLQELALERARRRRGDPAWAEHR